MHSVVGTYLDNIGAALYSKTQLVKHMQDLDRHVYGNPHSGNSCSQLSADLIQEARIMVANHFNTTLDQHHVIFTSGATGAIKIVAESFSWSARSCFVFLEDNHTSVVGVREVAKSAGAQVMFITEASLSDYVDRAKPDSGTSKEDPGDLDVKGRSSMIVSTVDLASKNSATQPTVSSTMVSSMSNKFNRNTSKETCHLVCYPAMSNFCGRKYPLSWVEAIHDGCISDVSSFVGRWYVLLDAASFVCTNPLDLSDVDADFVTVSFYKMFGFPTGIGALIVRADAGKALKHKCYYGGGTVLSTISSIDHHICKNGLADR